jgi:drug/metabolite transporter (DMT)-like permease
MNVAALAAALLVIALTTAGQMLLKKAAQGGRYRIRALFTGYALFLITVSVSFVLMHFMELKYFVVIMNMSYVTVMIASTLLFKERLNPKKIAGTLLVVFGAVIFAADW